MAALSYQEPNLVLRKGAGDTRTQVKDLQRDLRKLGYLPTGIDGDFGPKTELAVKTLQYDLIHNDGRGRDGTAPVRMIDYNKSRVAQVDGVVNQDMVGCIADMLADSQFLKLPASENPAQDNKRIITELTQMRSTDVPMPLLLAILQQESNLKHFMEPSPENDDRFVIVGLDRNGPQPYIITSRGYGVGQYTLFHHPPTISEVEDFILTVESNVRKAVWELQDKFEHFVNGSTSGKRADDRIAEFGRGNLRICKYGPDDSHYMRDCKICMLSAGTYEIRAGETLFYEGSKKTYQPTKYHLSSLYRDVPIRKNIGCDWPYAARRYNGSGVNSYHYQTKILLHIVKGVGL